MVELSQREANGHARKTCAVEHARVESQVNIFQYIFDIFFFPDVRVVSASAAADIYYSIFKRV